jgi:hypothetical protein
VTQALDCPEVYSYVSGFTTGWLITRLSILALYVIIAFYVKPQGLYLLQSKAPILITSPTPSPPPSCLTCEGVVVMISNYFIPSTEQYTHTYIIMAATLIEFFGLLFLSLPCSDLTPRGTGGHSGRSWATAHG